MSVLCFVCFERFRMLFDGVKGAELIRCPQHPAATARVPWALLDKSGHDPGDEDRT